MAPILQKGKCPNCGRSTEIAVRADPPAPCVFCSEETDLGGGDVLKGEGERRRALGRLRKRYGEAREMVSATEPHANLDWLIGSKGSPESEPVAIDGEMVQVALLWLQDLARELDREALLPAGSDSSRRAAGAEYRQAAAHSLRIATEDFAEAFREPGTDPAVSS